MVLADALQQAGDPRGELIALQLVPKPTPAQKKRARQLIDAHADALLGPLAGWTLKKDRRFEGGFLAACTYAKAKGTGDVEPPVTRAWSTVREVEGEEVPAAAVRQMRHVRHVGGLALADLPALGHGEPLPSLRTVRARGPWTEGLIDAIGSLPSLPGLQRLRIQVFGWANAAPTPAEVDALARALARAPYLRLDVPPFDVRLDGPADARAMWLEFNHGFQPNFRAAIAQVRGLSRAVRGLASVHVHSYDVGWLAKESEMLAKLPLDKLRAAAAPLPLTQTAEVREEGGWAAREREI